MGGVVAGRFANRLAIIIGRSAIALRTAVRLEAEGATVVRCENIAEFVDPTSAEERLCAIACEHGRIHCLAHIPEVTSHGRAADATETEWRVALDEGALSTWNAVRLAAEHMRARDGGSIVTVAGVTALVGVPGLSIASAVAGAVVALSRSLGLEYAPSVRINCVPMGWIDGDPLGGWYAEADPSRLLAMDGTFAPLDRLGTADEVVGTIAFLLSDESSSLLANYVAADGGYTVR
jgi:NAD(P)-dependent dehydrogenase (short-subunit alcohol dehydrogenase family)